MSKSILMWFTRLFFFLVFAPTKKNENMPEEECFAMFFCYQSKYLAEATKLLQNTDKDEANGANFSLELTPRTRVLGHSFRNHKGFTFEKPDVATMVADMAWQTVDQQVTKCYNVLMTMDSKCQLTHRLLRSDIALRESFVFINVMRFSIEEETVFLHRFWGDSSVSCRSLLIDLTCDANLDIYRILETSKLWQLNDVKVVLVGSQKNVHQSLLQRAFRNVPRPIYLALEEGLLQQITRPWDYHSTGRKEVKREKEVMVYGRCLFCEDGNPKVKFLAFWTLELPVPKDFQPFPDQENNLQGHVMQIVAMPIILFVALEDKTTQKGIIVTFGDCLDGWMINSISAKLNFSYEISKEKAPGGKLPNGSWTGIIGRFQRQETDTSTVLSFRAERIHLMDNIRTHVGEAVKIVSLKPQVLPRYLVIVRPFTVAVWLYLLMIVMLWGATLWLFQRMWSSFSGEKTITLGESIFSSWSVILEDPRIKTPTNIAGQILLGLWLMTCLVITTVYKSELTANLAVERSERPIDNLRDMVAQGEDYRWGMPHYYFRGAPIMFMEMSPDPVVNEVHKRVEGMTAAEGLQEVIKGGFSYMIMESQIMKDVAAHYTDDTGWTPFYLSKGEKMFADFSWPLRKGLPYGHRIKYFVNRLIETGIFDYWTQSLISTMKKSKQANQDDKKTEDTNAKVLEREDKKEESGILQLSHVLGIFLCLLIGFTTSLIILFLEMIIHKTDSTQGLHKQQQHP